MKNIHNDSTNNLLDNFTYLYYSGTNRLQKVTGTVNQYYYDANGNVTVDSVKQNYYIKYDWRNLITELRHWRLPPGGDEGGGGGGEQQIWVYKANYWYDEAGNRICKKTFVWQPSGQIEPGINSVEQIVEEGDNPTGSWNVIETIYYVRGVGGKEIAIYNGNNVEQWNMYGLDNVGAIKSNGDKHFYLKDHLGSIRAILDSTNTVVAAYDYDAWGFSLENRSYEPLNQRYKFTAKERDRESSTDGNGYDYFGARYYDSRIGRWGGVEPLYEKYVQVTPYGYSLCNPIKYFDIDGKKLFIGGEQKTSLQYLQSMFPEEQQYRIDYNHQSGEISFDVSGLDIMSDNAYLLISNLISSENNYLFEVADKTTGTLRNTSEGEPTEEISLDLTSGMGYHNLSVTPHIIDPMGVPHGLKPKAGYEGQVSMGKGEWTFGGGNNDYQPKSNMVFHELWENYMRTQYGALYTVAHNASILMAENYKKQVGEPGRAGTYKFNKE